MGYETGLLKYLINTPFTPVGFVSMCVYGGIVMATLNALKELFSGNLVDAFLEYFVYGKLPPTSVSQVLLLVTAGTIVAGLKWYIAMKIR